MKARFREEPDRRGGQCASRELTRDVRKHERAADDAEDVGAFGEVEIPRVDAEVIQSDKHEPGFQRRAPRYKTSRAAGLLIHVKSMRFGARSAGRPLSFCVRHAASAYFAVSPGMPLAAASAGSIPGAAAAAGL